MQVEYELTANDLIALQRHLQKRWPKHRQNSLVTVFWIIVILGAVMSAIVGYLAPVPRVGYLALLLLGIGVGVWMTLIGLSLYAYLKAPNAIWKALQQGRNAEKALGWRRVVIDAQGIHSVSEFFSIIYLWKGVDIMAKTSEYLFVGITTSNGFVVPLRAFADARTFDAFVETARRYHGMAGVGAAVREVIGEGSGREPAGPTGIQTPANADASGIMDGIVPKESHPTFRDARRPSARREKRLRPCQS